MSEKQSCSNFSMISQNLALFFHGHHQECQQQPLEMPQITRLFVINTNTNFEICSVLMPKALVLAVIENALQMFRK
jgi:hypothetical protein